MAWSLAAAAICCLIGKRPDPILSPSWHNLWIGVTLPFLSLLPRIGLLAGYGLVFGCGGYLLFDRKEA